MSDTDGREWREVLGPITYNHVRRVVMIQIDTKWFYFVRDYRKAWSLRLFRYFAFHRMANESGFTGWGLSIGRRGWRWRK